MLLIFLGCTIGVFYLKRGYKQEDRTQKLLLYGIACLIFGLALSRFCFFLSEYFIIGDYIGQNHEYYSDLSKRSHLHSVFNSLGHYISLIGFSLFFFFAERALNYKKYILTSMSIFFIFLQFLKNMTPIFEGISLSSIFEGIDALLVLFIFILFIKKSSEELQYLSVFIIIGAFLVSLGILLEHQDIKNAQIIPIWSPPIICIVGAIIFIIPNIIDLKVFSRVRPLFYIFIMFIFLAVIMLFGLFLVISLEETIIYYFTNVIGIIILLGFLLAFCIETLLIVWFVRKEKLQKGYSEKVDDKTKESLLTLFKKPEKFTEEEVIFHKEQKICLVCKSKIIRFNSYICLCDALYCQKCASTLATLENACWLCNAPFDESKPSNIIEEKEEEIDLEEEKHKKGNKIP